MQTYTNERKEINQRLSHNMHEDTFLMENYRQHIPESLLNICCEPHKQMAVFYSNQQELYKCFKCLLEE